ncbi:MAG: substrate-binding domain-containing protein [Defluviitaleaceae bacterium]|nr:substrate-binding domain-containing protein [Defluviitaleaceae bacterium]
MKKLTKLFLLMVVIIVSIVAVLGFTACANDVIDMQIIAVSRESGSGTRSQWDSSIHNNLDGGARVTLASWLAQPGNSQLAGEMQNGQPGVVTRIRSQRNAIGYASLSAVENDSNLRVLNIGGFAPGATGYPTALARDYVILTYENVDLLPISQLFLDFIQSTQGQAIVEGEGYDFSVSNPIPFTAPTSRPSGQTGPVQVRGSTSVEPVMQELIDGFVAAVSWAVVGDFDFQAGGSGQGVTAGSGGTIQGSEPNRTIGMSSNAAHIDTANASTFFLAQDTMAVIVHRDNPLTNITMEQLFAIYTGAATAWRDIIEA